MKSSPSIAAKRPRRFLTQCIGEVGLYEPPAIVKYRRGQSNPYFIHSRALRNRLS
jgi:hypothetical protein